MAIDTQFLQQHGSPYVHSDIFNFRYTLKDYLPTESASDILSQAITMVQSMRDQLQAEAERFLDGQSYQEASYELFTSQDKLRTAAMQAVRNPDFGKTILELSALNVDDPYFQSFFQEAGIDFLNDAIDFETLADKIVKDMLSGKEKEISKSKFSKLFTETGSSRKFITGSATFQKDVAKMLKKVAPIDTNAIWETFCCYFYKYANNITITTDNDTPEAFLKRLKEPFLNALIGAELRDINNISGWLGEAFKNAVWGSTSISFNFINIGNNSEAELKKIIKDTWNVTINSVPFGTDTSKSHSDWILKNQNGYIVRAQDKNTSTYLAMLKSNVAPPQIIKVQDEILYTTLQDKLKNYKYSPLTPADWDDLDYMVANTAWFSRYNTAASNQKRSTNYTSNLQGVRDLISRIFSEEIGYFAGVADLDLSQLGKGMNNTFFIIDNTILYPTYLMFDYILRQLQAGQEQLNRLQVTLSTASIQPLYSSTLSFEKAKIAEYDPAWIPNSPYSPGVLNVGMEQGQSILESLKISRINLRFDLQKILTTAYALDPTKLY